jgi:peptidoglycan/xylan/chitin deacetylase (PgdA/CDA1 family)
LLLGAFCTLEALGKERWINMSKATSLLSKLGRMFGTLFIFTIVLVVPLFSLWEIGHFFHPGGSHRSTKPLPVMTMRAPDAEQLPPQLFQEPLISVTFDDGFETTYTHAMPLLQKYGIHTTQYVLSGTSNQPTYVSWDQIKRMQEAGHEIACHSVNHPDLTTLDNEDLNWQLKTCKEDVEKHIGPIHNFASPYGSEDKRTLAAINKYYGSQRNTNGDPTNGVTDADVNLPDNFNRNDIIAITIRHDTTVDQLKKLVAYAKATNGWVVLTYHQADDPGSKFSVTDADFNKQFAYLAGTDVRIVTMQQALDSIGLKNMVEY